MPAPGDPLADDKPGGDRDQALARLSEAFRPSLVRYFQRRVKEAGEIDDLVQDVFVRLLVRGGVEDLDHAGGYVFETASSVLKDRLRRRASRRADAHVPVDIDHQDDAGFSAERVLLAKEALNRAALALLELPERTRTVFILRRLEGLQYQAIAQRLAISVSAVEKHMGRAMRRLMQLTGDEQ